MEDELEKMADDLFDELMNQEGGEWSAEEDLYEFEYEFMPELAASEWADDYSRQVGLSDTCQIIDNALYRGILIEFLWFNASRHRTDGLEVYQYDFPEPPRSPFAHYGVIICGERGTKYYTLEEACNCYMLCSPGVDCHENYGSVEKEIGKEGFIKLAIEQYLVDVD